MDSLCGMDLFICGAYFKYHSVPVIVDIVTHHSPDTMSVDDVCTHVTRTDGILNMMHRPCGVF